MSLDWIIQVRYDQQRLCQEHPSAGISLVLLFMRFGEIRLLHVDSYAERRIWRMPAF